MQDARLYCIHFSPCIMCSVNWAWSKHEGDIMSTLGGGGGGGYTRYNIFSRSGSVQYFEGYYEYIGGFQYLGVFNIN